MKHIMFNLLAAVSMVLCLSEIYQTCDYFSVMHDAFAVDMRTGATTQISDAEVATTDGVWIALYSVLPVVWIWRTFRRIKREKRMLRLQCAACGYDLRATPEKCPECGAVAVRTRSNTRRDAPFSSYWP